MSRVFDLSSVSFVKRVVIGQRDTQNSYDEEEANKNTEFLNRCLNDFPKGRIIACEKNFKLLNIGEHQMVQQWLVYHVGFTKKPLWMNEQ
ncbi:hypothetical protein [uncultured Campylobacter sp.]|uniref:hypothetical protein n=1 Tax=uncultured Campylobacter sp. TaxID=218934 RepID=UPI0026255EA5|nr:hypothetical protein [uncultured Campylobacter sp.]